MDMLLSVIVPCYNEEEVIEETYKRIIDVLVSNNYNYEIIFINDGSRDKTLYILTNLAANNSKVKVVGLSRNFGHQAAVSAGIKVCKGDIAIIIDADLQDPPEVFPEMIKLYEEHRANVVYAVRKERKGESWFKKFTASMFYKIINNLSSVKLPTDTGDFRLIDRKVINVFNSLPERDKYIRGLITWIGFKQVPIYYSRDARFAGETKYPLAKMIKFATTGLVYFSRKPLKLATNLGFFSFMIGIALVIYTFVSKFLFPLKAYPGWASLMIAVIFFGGIQLITIGVLGEYIGGMFEEIKGRPEYIIDTKLNIDN